MTAREEIVPVQLSAPEGSLLSWYVRKASDDEPRRVHGQVYKI